MKNIGIIGLRYLYLIDPIIPIDPNLITRFLLVPLACLLHIRYRIIVAHELILKVANRREALLVAYLLKEFNA